MVCLSRLFVRAIDVGVFTEVTPVSLSNYKVVVQVPLICTVVTPVSFAARIVTIEAAVKHSCPDHS
jgi:hypothetical protein